MEFSMATISSEATSRVTEDDVAFYRENGYLVIPDALTSEESKSCATKPLPCVAGSAAT